MRWVLASNNANKLIELRAVFADLAVELVAQGSLNIAEADEPHLTFVENALAKARHAAARSGLTAIADDSGLCVAALDGAPGVQSAHAGGAVALQDGREATRRAQDVANNAWLVRRLGDAVDRRARFVCALVAVRGAADPQPLIAIGRWEGEIVRASQGTGGFGYDPLVFIPALGATVAQLAAEVKNRHSHRALAAARMRILMRDLWRVRSG